MQHSDGGTASKQHAEAAGPAVKHTCCLKLLYKAGQTASADSLLTHGRDAMS